MKAGVALAKAVRSIQKEESDLKNANLTDQKRKEIEVKINELKQRVLKKFEEEMEKLK